MCKDVPPYAVVAGVPARIVKYRFNEGMVSELEGLNFNDIDEAFVRNNLKLLEEDVDYAVLDKLKALLG